MLTTASNSKTSTNNGGKVLVLIMIALIGLTAVLLVITSNAISNASATAKSGSNEQR